MTQTVNKEPILAASFTHKNKPETRTYDFRSRDGRHAFLRFASWALAEGIKVELSPLKR